METEAREAWGSTSLSDYILGLITEIDKHINSEISNPKQVDELKADLVSLRKQCETMQKSVDRWKGEENQENELLKAGLKVLETENRNSQQRYFEAQRVSQEIIDEKNEEILILKRRINSLDSAESSQEKDETIENLNQRLVAHDANYKQLELSFDDLQKMHDEKDARLKPLREVEQKYKQLEEKFRNLQSSCNEKDEELRDLRQVVQHYERLKGEFEELEQGCHEVARKILQLSKMKDKLSKDNAILLTQTREWASKVRTTTAQAEQLKESFRELLVNNEVLVTEYEESQDKINKLKKENKLLRSEVSASTKKHEEEIKNLKDTVWDLQLKINNREYFLAMTTEGKDVWTVERGEDLQNMTITFSDSEDEVGW